MNRLSPEGERWQEMVADKDDDTESELLSISVGNVGLIWAVTWSGNALARVGISQHHVMGNYHFEFFTMYIFVALR